MDDLERHALGGRIADREMVERPLGLRAPVARGVDLDLAHAVRLRPEPRHDTASSDRLTAPSSQIASVCACESLPGRLLTMDATLMAKLRAIPIFADLDDDALIRVGAVVTEFEAPAGHVLTQPGQEGSGMFILEEGSVTVELPGGGSRHARTGGVLRRAGDPGVGGQPDGPGASRHAGAMPGGRTSRLRGHPGSGARHRRRDASRPRAAHRPPRDPRLTPVETFDVGIVGAGVHGASAAFHLASRGSNVVIFERWTPAGGPTGRSSAVCRAYYTNTFLAAAARDSIAMMERFKELTGVDAGYRRTGMLFLHPLDDVNDVEVSAERLNRLGIVTSLFDPGRFVRRSSRRSTRTGSGSPRSSATQAMPTHTRPPKGSTDERSSWERSGGWVFGWRRSRPRNEGWS